MMKAALEASQHEEQKQKTVEQEEEDMLKRVMELSMKEESKVNE
eukprot:CAMPEP_0116883474 /NCGR_PEP_ID=MMETSP0463-20121206/15982_1 /TAXON_ID=181622 /ORGANISM="Strombidinopsis sp, Strain SopsisLIS2011" /LENGTH=43 /DNA_ID= /DNA_START= /DNA_END= /DNA_ORIENTATION=